MERLVSRVVLGTIAPVSLMLLGWWGTLALLGDSPLIPWAALGGLALGLVLDFAVIGSRLDSLNALPTAALTGIAVFYSVMIFGLFMGFPVPVLLVSIGWGFVAAHPRGVRAGQTRPRVHAASYRSALVMLVACTATAWLAFGEPTITSEVRGMLGLSAELSLSLLGMLSLLGGLGLVFMSYIIPVAIASRTAHRATSAAKGDCR